MILEKKLTAHFYPSVDKAVPAKFYRIHSNKSPSLAS